MQKRFIIAVDFDGTIVTHKYPDIGELVPYAKQVINMLVNNGNKVFLWTMRCHKKDRDVLDEASQFLKDNNINIELLNKSPAQFSDSPKQYANIYIDDAAIGIPLIEYKGNMVVHPDVESEMMASTNTFSSKEKNDLSKYNLTEKEIKIIEAIANGLSNKEIAKEIFLSEGTVKNNITNILGKLSLRDRTQIAIFAFKNGIVT